MSFRFTWDPQKATADLRKHRVSFEEAATAFADQWSITVPDPAYSQSDDQFMVGFSPLCE
ncbi:MAG: BrnT family toxin [Gemmatimonadales bacterium]